LTLSIGKKEPHRHPHVVAPWLLRYLEKSDEVTIEQAAMVAACLLALCSPGNDDATRTLRVTARRAHPRLHDAQRAAASPN
jgi:hypothetical protein